MKDVMKLEKVVNGMIIVGEEVFDCETCILGKMTQYRNRNPDTRATKILHFVHCDLSGPIVPTGKGEFRYMMSFVDDYSGVTKVYLLKNKTDTVLAAEKFIASMSPYGTVKRLRTDNGTEFTSESFRSLMIRNHIKQEFSAPYSPHQNGTVERFWRTLSEMARCLILESKLPKELWTYAVKTAAKIRNRCYNPRTGKTPIEILTGQKRNLSNMRKFGTVCYAYLQSKKFDARCERDIYVGYDEESPAYFVYFPEKNEVKKVRCVKFTDKFEQDLEGHDDYVHVYSRPKSQEVDEQGRRRPTKVRRRNLIKGIL
ncbi:hypothetical protein Pcinc_000749 [Petrolisthes cinctipes]|uniref:Integrase catalytic domain-containing protein n=1 Tax=Petrolisthes cinctipes TaxID=88211 RepID=A0AAE1L6B8_PETCI|nr:hypothetical protein Pcinc_000749 [Petrolisthes cinctipes]